MPKRRKATKRICLLTASHVSANPRLVKEADSLVDAGYLVQVIAADSTPWARAADESFKNRKWEVSQRLPFGPDAPAPVRALQLLRLRSARIALNLGLRQKALIRAAWHPIAPDLVTAASAVRAELYIAHYPAALPAAAIAAQKWGSLYGFDAEDFHLGDLPLSAEHEMQRTMVRAIEEKYLPGCCYVTAASPGIARAYAKEYGIREPAVLLNVFPRSLAPSDFTPRGSAVPSPSVYWFSQTIGPDRGLECAVRAISIARSAPHLYLRGTPSSGYLEQIQEMASDFGVVRRLHIVGPEMPSEMERLAACYDVGFIGETGHTLNRRIALTNKLFSYLLAGVPVVASDIPAHREIAPECGQAMQLFEVENSESLATALDGLLANPERLAGSREEAFRLGEKRFNWDLEKNQLLSQVSACLDVE